MLRPFDSPQQYPLQIEQKKKKFSKIIRTSFLGLKDLDKNNIGAYHNISDQLALNINIPI